MELKEKIHDLFELDEELKPPQIKLKEKIGESEDELINQLTQVRTIAIAYPDMLELITEAARQKKINLYVYRRNRGGRYKPAKRYYEGIYAVRAGNPKATQARALTGVVAAIDCYPHRICKSRRSNQCKMLVTFLKEISAAE